jgi:molecular chaperone GrpE
MKDDETLNATAGLEGDSPGDGGGEPEAVDADALIRDELAKVRQELEHLQELYLRKLADFDNYRKRQEREQAEFRRHANAELLRDCLPVLDNLERALSVPLESSGNLHEGVELVLRHFRETLARHGLEEVDPLREPFDPTLHEAIQRRESPDVSENTVVEVFQKGYLMHGRLLRPAMVVVAVPMVAKRGALPGPEDESEQ